ncbi:hypothetical protein [Streptomyces sp. BK79]|uniref:hypothetical protein n=1 Tax=Streptomyces sp. BK79 TaxID=3350097 RepID=UPI00376F8D2B
MEASGKHTRAERLTEGLTAAVATLLASVLLAAVAVVFGGTAWRLVTDPGTTTLGSLLAMLVLLAVVALPPLAARLVFLSRRRKGTQRLTAAVPAALTLLGASVVPFAVLCLIVVYAD